MSTPAAEAMAIQKPFRLTYFSERGSHFGVYWDPRRDIGWMGVDQLQVFGTRWNIPGGCPLKFVLRDEETGAVLGLAEDGTEKRRISYYPHQVVIESTLPGYRVQQTISFSECDRMVIGVEVTALGAARTCRLLAYGGGENEAARPCGENGVALRYPFGDDPDMQAKHLATRGPIDLAVLSQAPLEWHIGIARTALAAIKHNTLAGESVQSHDSSMNVDASQVDKLFYVTPRSGSCYIALSKPAKLVPGKSRRFVFALQMSYEQKRAALPAAPSASELKSARRYWQQILRALPDGTKADNKLMVRAVSTLESVRWKGVAGYKPYEASFPAKGWYNSHWLWDSCFHALGYAFYDMEVARDQVRLLLAYQDRKERPGAGPGERVPHAARYRSGGVSTNGMDVVRRHAAAGHRLDRLDAASGHSRCGLPGLGLSATQEVCPVLG